jgi:superfamily I DNA and RNA helicase
MLSESGSTFLSAKVLGTEYAHPKQLLFPVVRIDQAERNTCAYIDPAQRVEVLDDNQEAIARNCCSGYHIVRGPSGSGKTLILVHKAAFLRHYRPEIKSILSFCYNITLVNYIKRLLTRKGVALGPGGVEVYPFHELCSMILGEKIEYEKEGTDYYQFIEEETLARLKANNKRYDAVLLDEGQDFCKGMAEIVFSLVDPNMRNLTVAVDEGQNIYGRDAIWNPPSQDKIRIDEISGMYRNSAEIRHFALSFLKRREKSDLKGHSVYCETHGPKPEW